MVTSTPLEIPAVLLLHPFEARDPRGWFREPYNREAFARCGIDEDFQQDLETLSVRPGTVRGLHFQRPPFAQSKLVRVAEGAIFDVAVDLRVGSPTCGRHVGAELTVANGAQLYVPVGFAHGFMTLEPNTRVLYKISGRYAPDHATGYAWDDPDLAIPWPRATTDAVLSDRDRALPYLRDVASPFRLAAAATST